MPMTGVISGVLPSAIKRMEFTLPKGYQNQSMEVKWTGITNQQAEMINSSKKSNDDI